MYLNIGGVYFLTARSTLFESDSFFTGLIRSSTAGCCEFFVDRDPMYFRFILNWMRGCHYLPDDISVLRELSFEADFYCLSEMKALIAQRIGSLIMRGKCA